MTRTSCTGGTRVDEWRTPGGSGGRVAAEPVRRGEVWWWESPHAGRRPVVVLSRDAALDRLRMAIVAPCTTTIRASQRGRARAWRRSGPGGVGRQPPRSILNLRGNVGSEVIEGSLSGSRGPANTRFFVGLCPSGTRRLHRPPKGGRYSKQPAARSTYGRERHWRYSQCY